MHQPGAAPTYDACAELCDKHKLCEAFTWSNTGGINGGVCAGLYDCHVVCFLYPGVSKEYSCAEQVSDKTGGADTWDLYTNYDRNVTMETFLRLGPQHLFTSTLNPNGTNGTNS